MILFRSDYNRYHNSGVYMHETTKNKSFVKMFAVFRKMGVKNNWFHLTLFDKDLMNIDPHNLGNNIHSEELLLRIAMECRSNPWYFFREVFRVPASGGDPIPFQAHRGNISMIWVNLNNIDYFSVQPRQTFKTTTACGLCTYIIYIYGYNIELTLYTKDSDLVQANVGRIKVMRDALPKYLINHQGKDTDNKEGLSYTALGNRYRTRVAQSDKQGADNIGRGMTTPYNHIDEPAYCTNIHITYPVMMFATTTARANAKRNNQPYGNILTTTAGRTDTDRGRYAFEIMNGCMPFTEKLYDCENNEELRRILRANSTNDMINGTFSYLMLGYTREWFIDQIRLTKATPDEVDRDLLNIWKSGTETGILNTQLLKVMNDNRWEPVYVEMFGDYVVSWYIPQEDVESPAFRHRQLALGMDSSENIGRDFTALVLIDMKDMSVIATFRCNESNTIKLAMFIADFLVKYRNILFVPERKSTGGAIIDQVIDTLHKKGINPIRRIFNKMIQERDTEEMRDIKIDDPAILDSKLRRHLGFITTEQTRKMLYKQVLVKAVSMNAARIYDKVLITELSTLSTINGRIDHTTGSHDDMVIAYLLACFAIFNGKNLHHYGIRINDILSGIVMATGQAVDPAYKTEQLELRKRIKHYEALISQIGKDQPALVNGYRQRISELKQYVDDNMVIEPIAITKVDRDVVTYGDIYAQMELPAKPKLDQQQVLQIWKALM